MKKTIFMFIILTTILVSCSKPEEQQGFSVGALNGPTAIGFVSMMENPKNQFKMYSTPDEIVAQITKGELDIAAVPSNLASVLYNKTEGDITVLAVNTLGVLYVVEAGDTIKKVEDLEGKTVYLTGKGASPEYSFDYVLDNYQIKDKVTTEFKTEHSELATLLASGAADVAVLPEPFVTSALYKNENLRVALDLNQEFEKSGSTLITGVLIVRNEILENNKDAIDAFLKDYKNSIKKANNEVENTATLVEKFDILPSNIAKTAIPNCNITYIDGDNMKQKLSAYLEILFNANPKSVGGAMPGDDFYYKK